MHSKPPFIKMSENGTYYTATEIISAQLIVVSVVTVTSVLLLIAILAITITTAVERCRQKTQSYERPLECNVFLVQDSGRVVGTIRPVGTSHGQGYEDMSLSTPLTEAAPLNEDTHYESVE